MIMVSLVDLAVFGGHSGGWHYTIDGGGWAFGYTGFWRWRY